MDHKEKNENKETNIDNTQSRPIPVIGIGASAGGLQALEKFFRSMPTDLGAAFVIVQHLDPDHESILSELIGKYTKMEVIQIVDKTEIEPDHVYIIPPAKVLELRNNVLHLKAQQEPRSIRLPIDDFFRSLAKDKKDHAIAVILSGTGTDGTLGIREIKSANGVVFAQSPEDAKFDGMPNSAISSGMVDFILDADKILIELKNYLKYLTDLNSNQDLSDIYSFNTFNKIFSLLYEKTGHDFSNYKANTIVRRIERRMNILKTLKIEEYLEKLKKNNDEVKVLFEDLLIGVTSFFRDQEVFSFLSKEIIPQLFEQAQEDKHIRLWITACSTGEEAYSIAILLKEHIQKYNLNEYSVQIFATDLDKRAVEKARQGTYPDNITTDLSPHLLKKYFTAHEKTITVNKSIRDMIVFAEQSLIKDPPFSKVDFISCRNLLIYMNSQLQEEVITSFHYSLKEDGFLLLGASETLGKKSESFEVIDKKNKFYQKKPQKSLHAHSNLFTNRSPIIEQVQSKSRSYTPKAESSLGDIIQHQILEHFTPAAVLINKELEILYLKGDTSKYLSPVQGVANMNIVEMAKPDLKVKLRLAISKVKGDKLQAYEETIQLKKDKSYSIINLHVLNLEKEKKDPNLFLVVFEDVKEVEIKSDDKKASRHEDIDYIKTLENELRQNKEYLQAVIEEAETANEEIKATNEELQSSNEELQSTNEELETSKEELQSINEELTTLNTEYQNKIEELSETNNDISNILANTEIAIIFLDLNLRIKKFTPKTTEIIGLIEGDINRPIENFVTKLNYPDFIEDMKHVINTLNTVEKDIDSKDKHYLSKIKPYRTLDNVVTGLVLTFIDITKIKSVQNDLNKTLQKLKFHTENTPLAVIEFNSSFEITYWSEKAKDLFGWSKEEVLGKTSDDFSWLHNDDLELSEKLNKELQERKKDNVHVSTKNYKKDGSIIFCEWYSSALFNESNELISVHAFVLDKTESEENLARLKESELKYHNLFDNSPDSIILHDLKMDIIDANAKAIDEFGYSKPEILELSVFDLHPKIEQPHSEEVLEQVKKSDSEDPLKVIGKFQRKDKSIFTAEAQPIKCTYLGKEIVQVIIKNLSNDDSITMDS